MFNYWPSDILARGAALDLGAGEVADIMEDFEDER